MNPTATELQGVRCYPDISEVPGPVDAALVVVPAGAVLEVVRSCGQAGVRGLIVMSGGFAESGGEGLESQREIVRAARAQGIVEYPLNKIVL